MKLMPIIHRFEWAAIMVAILGAFFHLLQWSGATALLTLGVSVIALLEVIKAFAPDPDGYRTPIVRRAKHFSLAILLLGTLAYLLHWPHGVQLIKACMIPIAIVLIWEMLTKEKR